MCTNVEVHDGNHTIFFLFKVIDMSIISDYNYTFAIILIKAPTHYSILRIQS